MVLLHVLYELASARAWRLTIAHLNHQLRGRSSDADEALVRRVASQLKIPIVVGQANVRALAKKEKLSLEMAARKARHDFLARTALRLKVRKIALAHHADDQLELFFLRFLRGSSGEGLAGMKWSNPSPSNPRVELVRPLLDQPKSALLKHATAARIPFREDATNASLDFQRNRIRHELLPLLRRNYQPALDRAIARLGDVLRSESEFVGDASKEWLKKRKLFGKSTTFDKLPTAIQRRCIQLQLINEGLAPEFDLIEELRIHADHPVTVGSSKAGDTTRQAIRDSHGRVRVQTPSKIAFNKDELSLTLGSSGSGEFAGVRFTWKIISRKSSSRPPAKPGEEYFDADKIGRRILLRHWLPGDRFQPIGLASTIKLQDFFTNQKISRDLRHNLIIGVAGKGGVFWIEDMRISDPFKLIKTTNRCLQWRWKRL